MAEERSSHPWQSSFWVNNENENISQDLSHSFTPTQIKQQVQTLNTKENPWLYKVSLYHKINCVSGILIFHIPR